MSKVLDGLNVDGYGRLNRSGDQTVSALTDPSSLSLGGRTMSVLGLRLLDSVITLVRFIQRVFCQYQARPETGLGAM